MAALKDVEFDLANEHGKRTALRKICSEYWTIQAKEDPLSLSTDPRLGDYIRKIQENEGQNETGKDCEWCFITINPDPKKMSKNDKDGNLIDSLYNFHFFQKKVEKSMKKNWVLFFRYTYEYYTEKGERLHVHAVIRKPKDKRPSEVKREMWNTFKEFCGNPQHVKIVYLYSPEVVRQKLDYIAGVKQPCKMDAVKQDREWRDKNAIQQMYVSSHGKDDVENDD